MASIVLGFAGSLAGGPVGARIGQTLGRIAESTLLSPSRKLRPVHGPKLADLGVQTSTYGKMIPIIYGMARVGGNIIWSRPIQETVTTTTSSSGGGGKGGGGRVSQSSTTYSYSATLAVGVCEGPVDEVLRIWADAKLLDTSQYTLRVYKGSEEQLPDGLLTSFEGASKTPAYRGLSYVVFENFPLADYGNRIPNFTFEVQKKAQHQDYSGELLEEMLHGVVMIPGAGEFVYDTHVEYKIPGVQVGPDWVQQGSQERINLHNPFGRANALLSLDQLKATCPNVQWVSVVVGWFADSLNAADCVIKPGVEYQIGAITSPHSWQVAGFDRFTARLITQIEGAPQYGGTPDDGSLLRYLDALRARGYQILFYPLFFMDVDGKPWRGDLSGDAAAVSNFFTKADGYNAFITHYANLVAGRVDAFSIGSELKGLTKVTDTPGDYPAVTKLVSLAANVKSILGAGVKVTYAADWSEYHHTDGGWYHLDPLWASPDIDVIGIDAYFPLTDAPQHGYNVDAVKAGWTSGEGYDWYYSDSERTVQTPLAPEYAWKNIAWFWDNLHVNPDASTTAWVPQSKKVWFTEYGFPSVDGAANQPNVFFNPDSVQSAFPYYSKGRIDFRAQRVGLVATEQQWKDSEMVERLFAWTWDARPFPYWPDLINVWSDGEVWKTGHWIQGKLGLSSVAAVVSDLVGRAGLVPEDLDVDAIASLIDGFVISHPQTVRETIETLQAGYFFDVVESDDILKFVPRGEESILDISQDDLVPARSENKDEVFQIIRQQEVELPKRVNIVYLNRLYNYQTAMQYSQREATASLEVETLDLPIVFSDQLAKSVADITLFSSWVGRTRYQFDLSRKYTWLDPSDVISVTAGNIAHRMRILSTYLGGPGILRVKAVAEDSSTYDFYTAPGSAPQSPGGDNSIPDTRLDMLDVPAFPGDESDRGVIRMGGIGLSHGWIGAAIYRSDDAGANYTRISDLPAPACVGTTSEALAEGVTDVFDRVNSLTVVLLGNGELQSVSELAVLNGANAAAVGGEIIQFKTATLVEPGKYVLSTLLRGRLGTEWATATHVAAERFVLLDGRLGRQIMANNVIGLLRHYKPVTFGSTLGATQAQDFTYTGVALKPYSPVHIRGARDGGGNLAIEWVRRTRLGGNWQDGVDVPLNEETEAYEVEIMDGSDVVRTIIGLSSPAASYTAAEQAADFGGSQASVSLRVYQISGIVGRGYAGVGVI